MRFITVSLALVAPFLLTSSAASIGRRDTQMVSMISQDGSKAQNIVAVNDNTHAQENSSNLVASNSGTALASQTPAATTGSSEPAERIYMVLPTDEDDIDEMNQVLVLNNNVAPPSAQNTNVVMAHQRLENERDELLRKRGYNSDSLDFDDADLGIDSVTTFAEKH
ncbi:hypothetical protein EDC96DRAFT_547082 [Choanephora cucurbitarum]|nr:hypothetical protein EDC96DRAFT_547082 [Choanephora cucurbitarum]